MKKTIYILIILLNVSFVFAGNIYLETQFLKDKLVLEKEAYQEFRNSNLYKKQDSCIIKFIYIFDLSGFFESDATNSKYMPGIKPEYCYRKLWFYRKIQLQKRLCAEGYVFNKNNTLIAKIHSARGYPFKIDSFVNSDYYNSRIQVFKDKTIDLFFYVGYFNKTNVIWCLKGDQTVIYDIDKAKYIPLEEYYKCCWKDYRPIDQMPKL